MNFLLVITLGVSLGRESKHEQTVEDTNKILSNVMGVVTGRETLGDDFVPVYVTAVEHPEHFWLQFLSNKSAELDKLLEQMTDFYGHKNLVSKMSSF